MILIDCGACINIMPHSLLRKIEQYDTNLKSNNMVLSNYEGNTSGLGSYSSWRGCRNHYFTYLVRYDSD